MKELKIALIREGKIPQDNRVAFTPRQCNWIANNYSQIKLVIQPAPNRCFSDEEYRHEGLTVQEDISDCDILMGIKEVPVDQLIPGKTYFMFSHTRKEQPYNQKLMRALLDKKITLIDYECLTHEDGHRILGFGFFAGVVGAHNGLMAYGKKTGAFAFKRVTACKNLQELSETYFGIKLPPLKIVITGSGRVAAGILEVMGMLGIKDVPRGEFLISEYKYPVYTQLKAGELYLRKQEKTYDREDFHLHPEAYECEFLPFVTAADLLINGIYWDKNMAPLFPSEEINKPHFRIKVISDITNDLHGSVPCNLGDSTIEAPVYGVDRKTLEKRPPYLPETLDMMCVGNLPNELPRDASQYFGDQLMKYVLDEIFEKESRLLQKATIVSNGKLTGNFSYLHSYAMTGQPKH